MTPTCPKCGTIACEPAGPVTMRCWRCNHRGSNQSFQRGGPEPSLRWATKDPDMRPPLLQEERSISWDSQTEDDET